MISYLLLRNNKENGPYSLEQIVELGLKPYDLVWVNGKSAAWRYPSEVNELKPYAPIIEEQPYDRFFKKDNKTQESLVVSQPGFQEKLPQAEEALLIKLPVNPVKKEDEKYLPTAEQENKEAYQPRKSVFVTLPGGQQATIAKKPVERTAEVITEKKLVTLDPIPSMASRLDGGENIETTVKYSQPLDEIKEMYVKNLKDRKQKIARREFVVKKLKKASVFVYMLILGGAIGFAVKSTGAKKQTGSPDPTQLKTASLAVQSAAPDTATLAMIPTPPVQSSAAIDEAVKRQMQSQQENSPTTPVTVSTPSPRIPVAIKAASAAANNSDLDDTKDPAPTVIHIRKETLLNPSKTTLTDKPADPLEINPVTGERTKKLRPAGSTLTVSNDPAAPSGDKTVARPTNNPAPANSALAKLVTVKSNDYKRVAFGGIRDLQLTVTNQSRYTVDNVTVELQYIKPSEETLKTENVQFKSIGPNSAATIKIPDTNRGIRVSYRITHIDSREAGNSLAGF